MENLIIKGTDDTPDIKFLKEENVISISGMSMPEDVKAFYKPIVKWLEDYFKNPNENSIVNFNLTYFNTASSKMILDILYIFKKAINNGYKVNITWSYDEDDEEMLETGQDYTEIVDIPMNFREVSLFNV
jgi:SiaC family regulatory phosphoprotein